MSKALVEDCWHGCYRKGWGRNRLRPESFAHPAKVSYGLSVRIYEHAIEEGWVKPGDYVVDCFSGVGGFALEAMRHGLNFIGVELERRFVDMGQGCDCTGIGKEDWVRLQGRWDKMRYEDERHWCPQCLARAGAVTGEREFKALPLPGTKWAAIVKTRQATLFDAAPSTSYVRNSGKVPCTVPHHYRGNIETWAAQGMAGSAVIVQGDSRRLGEMLARARLCLSSPPYSGNFKSDRTHERRDERRLGVGFTGRGRGCFRGSETYGSDPANLGNLPDTGFEAALSPPVYTVTPKKSARAGESPQATLEASPGIFSEAQEGAGQPVLAVSSPVYAGSLQGNDAQDYDNDKLTDAQAKGQTAQRATWGVSRGTGTLSGKGYGQQPGQLAQMPEGDLAEVVKWGVGQYGERWQDVLAALPEGDHEAACERPTCAISSPPYAQSNQDYQEGFSWIKTDRDYSKENFCGQAKYGQSSGQLAAMPPGDHAAALEAEAETGRAQTCISSPPWENIVNTKDQKYVEGKRLFGDYGNAAGQLGQQQGATFWAASRLILEEVYKVLAPGAHAIFVCKRFVRDKKIVEFPLQWARLCEAVGFEWLHHHKAWLVEDRGAQHTLEGGLEERQVKRMSFFRRLHAAKYPHLEILWEDILCFVKE